MKRAAFVVVLAAAIVAASLAVPAKAKVTRHHRADFMQRVPAPQVQAPPTQGPGRGSSLLTTTTCGDPDPNICAEIRNFYGRNGAE